MEKLTIVEGLTAAITDAEGYDGTNIIPNLRILTAKTLDYKFGNNGMGVHSSNPDSWNTAEWIWIHTLMDSDLVDGYVIEAMSR